MDKPAIFRHCSKCGELKERTPEFFYRDCTSKREGLHGWCKACSDKKPRKDGKELYKKYGVKRLQRESLENHLRVYGTTEPLEMIIEADHKTKIKANSTLNGAIRTGKIRRPARCEQCGKPKMVTGHHVDYNRPLYVYWLCYACHMHEHWCCDRKRKELEESCESQNAQSQKTL